MYAPRPRIPALSLLSIAALATPAGASLFASLNGQMQATARITGVGNINEFLNIIPPNPGSVTAALGDVSATVGYSIAEDAGYSRLDMTAAENCSSPIGASQATAFGQAIFTGAAGTHYAVSGIVSVPISSAPSVLHVEVSLTTVPDNVTIFRHSTNRGVFPGSSVVVGHFIPSDILVGSPTGLLAADTTYSLAINIGTPNSSPQSGGEFSNAIVSIALALAPCYANCDGSTVLPRLNANDFACFLN